MSSKIVKNRIFSLDLLKAISISTVVFFHSSSNLSESTKSQLDILISPLRFCVPLLLTISFLLLKRSRETNSADKILLFAKKRFFRLLIPILFWFGLATLLTIILGKFNNERIFLKDLVIINLQGQIFWGAYFLIILLECLVIFVIFNNYLDSFKSLLTLLCFQLLIFIFCYILLSGILSKDISSLLCYFSRPPFFYWVIYIFLGSFFYKKWFKLVELSQKSSKLLKIVILSLTSLVMIVENTFFHKIVYDKCAFGCFEYLRFSCILSVFVMFLCFASLEEDHIPPFGKKIVFLLSKYSLGIFCINGILSKLVLPLVLEHVTTTPISNFYIAVLIKLIVWLPLLILSLSLSVVSEKLGLKKCVC
jgi:hypothetical protein